MAKPVRSRTNAASALPIGSPTTSASRAVSTRRAPEDMTSTAPPVRSARNTSEFAICATSQPRNAAAACAVRAAPGSSTIAEATPAASSAALTRTTPGLASTSDIAELYRAARLGQQALHESDQGISAAPDEQREVRDGHQVGHMAKEDEQAVALQAADRQEQQGDRGEGIAERYQAEWRHQQQGAQDQRAVVDDAHGAIGSSPRNPLRPADA